MKKFKSMEEFTDSIEVDKKVQEKIIETRKYLKKRKVPFIILAGNMQLMSGEYPQLIYILKLFQTYNKNVFKDLERDEVKNLFDSLVKSDAIKTKDMNEEKNDNDFSFKGIHKFLKDYIEKNRRDKNHE